MSFPFCLEEELKEVVIVHSATDFNHATRYSLVAIPETSCS